MTATKIFPIAGAVFVAVIIAFAFQTWWRLAYGRVATSISVELGSVEHRVLLRERCISDTYLAILDRVGFSRVAEYEYWTELRRGRHLAALSEREHWDSFAYDHPRIDSADASGVIVSLDPRPPYPSVHRFDWLSTPN